MIGFYDFILGGDLFWQENTFWRRKGDGEFGEMKSGCGGYARIYAGVILLNPRPFVNPSPPEISRPPHHRPLPPRALRVS